MNEIVNEPREPEQKPPLGAELFSWIQAVVLPLIIIIVAFTFVGRVMNVDGSSMVPTFQHGDLMLVQSIGYEPENGDIVILTKDSFMEAPIVKRVIATEGQHIQIDYAAGTVTVDGQVLSEPYINGSMEQPWWDEFGTDAVVPEGHIFVLGDNRNASSDSRDSRLGMVDERCIIGKVFFRIFPFGEIGPIHSADH